MISSGHLRTAAHMKSQWWYDNIHTDFATLSQSKSNHERGVGDEVLYLSEEQLINARQGEIGFL